MISEMKSRSRCIRLTLLILGVVSLSPALVPTASAHWCQESALDTNPDDCGSCENSSDSHYLVLPGPVIVLNECNPTEGNPLLECVTSSCIYVIAEWPPQVSLCYGATCIHLLPEWPF